MNEPLAFAEGKWRLKEELGVEYSFWDGFKHADKAGIFLIIILSFVTKFSYSQVAFDEVFTKLQQYSGALDACKALVEQELENPQRIKRFFTSMSLSHLSLLPTPVLRVIMAHVGYTDMRTKMYPALLTGANPSTKEANGISAEARDRLVNVLFEAQFVEMNKRLMKLTFESNPSGWISFSIELDGIFSDLLLSHTSISDPLALGIEYFVHDWVRKISLISVFDKRLENYGEGTHNFFLENLQAIHRLFLVLRAEPAISTEGRERIAKVVVQSEQYLTKVFDSLPELPYFSVASTPSRDDTPKWKKPTETEWKGDSKASVLSYEDYVTVDYQKYLRRIAKRDLKQVKNAPGTDGGPHSIAFEMEKPSLCDSLFFGILFHQLFVIEHLDIQVGNSALAKYVANTPLLNEGFEKVLSKKNAFLNIEDADLLFLIRISQPNTIPDYHPFYFGIWKALQIIRGLDPLKIHLEHDPEYAIRSEKLRSSLRANRPEIKIETLPPLWDFQVSVFPSVEIDRPTLVFDKDSGEQLLQVSRDFYEHWLRTWAGYFVPQNIIESETGGTTDPAKMDQVVREISNRALPKPNSSPDPVLLAFQSSIIERNLPLSPGLWVGPDPIQVPLGRRVFRYFAVDESITPLSEFLGTGAPVELLFGRNGLSTEGTSEIEPEKHHALAAEIEGGTINTWRNLVMSAKFAPMTPLERQYLVFKGDGIRSTGHYTNCAGTLTNVNGDTAN